MPNSNPQLETALTEHKRALGLFQKLCTLIFLFIGIIVFARSYVSYQQTMTHMREHSEEHLAMLQKTFYALTERSSQELFRASSQYQVTSLAELQRGTFSSPSLTSGIDSVLFISPNRTIIASIQQEGRQLRPTAEQIDNALRDISTEQRPKAALICNEQCFNSAYVPVITDEGEELIINLNRSSTLLLQDFFNLTNAELLLLHPSRESDLGSHVLMASHPDASIRILKSALNTKPSLLTPGETFIGETPVGYFSLAVDNVDTLSPSLLFGVLVDESHIPGEVTEHLRQAVITSLITLVLVSLVVYFVLKPPLDRLAAVTRILPQLPNEQFALARRSLQRVRRRAGFRDEIDDLINTTAAVNDALEKLSLDVQSHREELQDKVHALTEAKRFNELLLDNAPIVVILHEADGRIRTLNGQGRALCGLDNAIPAGANINLWIRDPERGITLSQTLEDLIQQNTTKLQNEFPFLSYSGELRHFLWTHSRVEIDDESLLLSLGVDITETRRAEESLRWLGEHDRVTGLLNRATFTEQADLHIQSLDNVHDIDLIMADIDNFSEFNDRFGFENGDKLLRAYAQHMAQHFGSSSLLARTGSGEFCALRASSSGAKLDAKQLEGLTALSIDINGQRETVSITVIVERYRRESGSIDDLLSDSTSVMNLMKAKAKGHVYLAEDDDGKKRREEKYLLKQQLLRAFSNNRIVLFFQPIVDLSSGKMTHCECLIRMLDNDGNFIPPASFLDIANEAGLMPRLDYLVIEKAMRQQVVWQRAGVNTRLSINITAPTLDQPDFAQRIAEIVNRTGADPRALIFELVETDALQDIDNARRLLKQLQALGASIALDDFGIGFTSFEYVRELPVDYIKIDKAFVQFVHERENDRVLVRSIVEMSHGLGKRVIAEGVDSRQALEVLRALDVDYIQGYYISRPVPINALNLHTTLPD